LTRNPEGEKAKALLDKGVHEVVQADFDKPETLKTALEGCYGAFLVTNFWEHMDAKREFEQGKAFGDACKEAKVEHVVLSTLPDTRE
jgi:uncharacterized protein YbjT (DUF2867 family)